MPKLRHAASAPARLALSLTALTLTTCAAADAPAVSAGRMTPIVRAVQAATPSVVDIQGQKPVDDPAAAARGIASTRQQNGMGTGVVIDPRGYILTNHHVVDGMRRINATLESGQTYVAEIVARDRQTDLAVIRIRAPHQLPVVQLGTSEDLMTGEPVIAVGNAFGYEHTVTTGIISALHRNVQVNETLQYLDLIQTDASINPGNSGGPLLNIDGKMIGLNVAVRAGAQGIGFAIPVDKALDVAAQMMSIERIDNHWHGMTPLAIDGPMGPVSVANLHRNGPADQCGLQRGDQLVSIGSIPIARPLDVERALLGRRDGEKVPVVALRDGREFETELPITSRASADDARQVALSPADAAPKSDDWNVLGLELQPASRSDLRQYRERFRGGMRVVKVRKGSSAENEGVLEGDILVRVQKWYVTNQRDITFIVERADALPQSLEFDIVRGSKWYRGKLALNADGGLTR